MAVAKKTAAKPVAKTQVKEEVNVKPAFEFKDRTYFLKGNSQPLSYQISGKHSVRKPLLYFDPEKGYNREVRYATNMPSPFKDEQEGVATLGQIVFVNGGLNVPANNIALQKILSLYHPGLNRIYEEYDPVGEAVDEMEYLDREVDALLMAREVDIDTAEAIMRTQAGSGVNKLSSKELRRDLLVFARNNPFLFLELAEDENIAIKNIGIKAVEQGLLKLSADKRLFTLVKGNKKLMTVPFEEEAYDALGHFFKTDEGMSLYKSLSKQVV